MLRRSFSLVVAALCVLTCALALAVWAWRPGSDIRTEDQNHDGRPDVWRAYDRHGHLARVSVDTNFDGRSDVQEFYEGGALVRRESDRDFNDRVDLVQDFDVQTRQSVRSLVDVDFDGAADLLVLFQNGQPVYSKWAGRTSRISARAGTGTSRAVASRAADDRLAPLDDPFRSDLSVRAARGASTADDCVELSASAGLPTARTKLPNLSSFTSDRVESVASHVRAGFVEPYSPRGPPTADLSI